MSHRPALLQAGDQGGMRAVRGGDVGERPVRTDRGEAAAEGQLGRGGRCGQTTGPRGGGTLYY